MVMSPKIFIAGHKGMVGSAIYRQIKKNKSNSQIFVKSKKQLDLTKEKNVYKFFEKNKFDQVYLCAARVGGILANMNYPVDFLLDNIKIQNNIITACHKYGVKNLIFIGSSCIYPKNISRKIKETDILTGELEKTNEAYALAKITGIKLIQSINQQYKKYNNFKILMPCNLYGPNDNYHANNSHVIAALIRKFSTAKKKKLKNITIWGTGKPRREFMYVDNFAKAAIFFMKKKINNRKNENYLINIGCGDDLTIKELVIKLSKIFNYKGKITFDKKKPDGVKRKLLNINKARRLGWKSKENFDYELKNHINKENFFEKNFN